MISNTNQANPSTEAKTNDSYHQDWYFSSDDCREEDDIMMERMEEERIFRDVPDVEHTPIEKSNDTLCSRISLSPAWSQDSMEHLDPVKESDQKDLLIYFDEAPLSSVNKISDFVMDSGKIQKLNFSFDQSWDRE